MTIRLGASTFNQNNDTLEIQPPAGFNTVNALRITNYTVDVLILTNIMGNNNSDRQYLMPLEQMVFAVENVQTLATMQGLQLGADIEQERVLIEWADNGLDDFEGTYPVFVTILPQFTDTNWQGDTETIDMAGSLTVPANPRRQSTTIVNESTTAVLTVKPSTGGNGVLVQPLAAMTYNNGSEAVVTTDTDDTTVSWFGEI